MSYLDRAFQDLSQWLTTHFADAADVLAVPVFVLIGIIAARLLIKRVFPVVLRVVVVPVLVSGIAIVGIVTLAVQLGLASICRMLGLRPPSPLYTAGDLTIAALSRLGRLHRLLPARRIESLGMWAPLTLIGVLVWRWNAGYCDRDIIVLDGCVSPVSESFQALGALFSGI